MQKIRKCKDFVLQFIKKYWFLFVLLGLELFLAKYVVVYFLNTLSVSLFLISTIYVLWIVTLYVYLESKGLGNWLNKHQVFITFLGVVFPIMLFFFHDSVQSITEFKKYEVVLKEENSRNITHLESIVTDLTRDPSTIFWRDFYIDSYKQYWDYIHLNYSQECKNLYAELTIGLGLLNNMNQTRRELILVQSKVPPVNLTNDMIRSASGTRAVLVDIIAKCQKL